MFFKNFFHFSEFRQICDIRNFKKHLKAILNDLYVHFKIFKECRLPAIRASKLYIYISSLRNLKTPLNFFKLTVFNVINSIKFSLTSSYYYIRSLILILIIDALITDDEPLWEPIEWSLVQIWILFIFMLAWIGENLINSRYGAYTGRDKRIWFSWYKSFWLIELWYILSLGLALLFVITPYYFEITYKVSFIISWWDWINRSFFFNFISLYVIIIYISIFLQINLRWLNWKKLFLISFFIFIFIAYLLYSSFMVSFFAYFTDPLWYQKTRYIDYIQLSNEPLKWGWGSKKRDHYSYHSSSTVFWFRNDRQFAEAFLFIHFFFFFSLFFLFLFWLTYLRRIYATKEVWHTQTSFTISSLKQFFYFFFMFYLLVFFSFIINYWRYPFEYFWIISDNSWFDVLLNIITDLVFF